MIIVIGHITVKPDAVDQARALSLDHVQRSRAEPGCLSHAVSVDCEDPAKFVFVEHWSDRAALRAHFALESSQHFVRDLSGLLTSKPSMKIFQAEETSVTT